MSSFKSKRKKFSLQETQTYSVEEGLPLVDEKKLRAALKSMFIVPMFFTQLTGSIFFIVDKQNQLTITKPLVVTLIVSFFLTIVYVLFYFTFSKFCGVFFLEYNEFDRQSNVIQIVSQFTNALILRVWIIKKWEEFKLFHENLNKLTCDLVIHSQISDFESFPESGQPYMGWIKRNRREFCKHCWLCVCVLSVNCILFSLSGYFFSAVLYEQSRPLMITLVLASSIWMCVNYVSTPSITCWFICYIRWMRDNFNFIAWETENLLQSHRARKLDSPSCTKYALDSMQSQANELWNHLERLETIVDKFNTLFGVPIIAWTISTSALILHQSFIVVKWIQQGIYIVLLFMVIMFFLQPLCVWNLCNASFKFSSRVSLLS